MEHEFKVGQAVEYHPPRGLFAPRGTYIVTSHLPARDGELEYHIKHLKENPRARGVGKRTGRGVRVGLKNQRPRFRSVSGVSKELLKDFWVSYWVPTCV
jgi:hypothetical protein